MASLSLGEAAETAGASKADIWRAVREGGLSAQRTDDGGFAIDPVELFRVFEAPGPKQPAMEQNAAASTEASGQTETSIIPETAETNDMAVAFATLGAELKGLLGLPAEERANSEPRQRAAERLGTDLPEHNAQPAAELHTVPAAAEKAIAEHSLLVETLAATAEARRPWWRRLVGRAAASWQPRR
jgi:hypothetical protein